MPRARARTTLALVIATSLTVGLASACSSNDGTEAVGQSTSVASVELNPYEQQRSDGVTALLERLSAAIRTGDVRDVETLIDPAASGKFRDRMRSAAAAFAPDRGRGERGGPLAVTTFEYRLAPTGGAEHHLTEALSRRLDDQGSSDTLVSPVELTYALGGAHTPGLDEPVITLAQTLAFARYDDTWKLVGDDSVAAVVATETYQNDPQLPRATGPRPEPEVGPWDYRGVAARDVPTGGGISTLLSYPHTTQTVELAAQSLPTAVAAVERFWGQGWPRRAAVVVTGAAAEFDGLTRTQASETASAAAATVYARIDRDNRQVVGQRIVLAPAVLSLSKSALDVLLRHELFHVAARATTAEDAPVWLTEGVAEFVGRAGTSRDVIDQAPELAAAVAGGDLPTALPADREFTVSSDQARIAYQTAWSFAAFIAERYGVTALRRLYSGVAGGGSAAAADAAMAKAVGHDRAALIKQWQAWLRKAVK